MRLLHQRHHHDRDRTAGADAAGQSQRDRRRAGRAASVPMRLAGANPARGRPRHRRTGGLIMTSIPVSLAANPRLSQWVSFDTDGVVTLRTGKVELGQGAVTAIAAIAAKELGIDLDRIRMTPADTAVSPDEGYTSGSF